MENKMQSNLKLTNKPFSIPIALICILFFSLSTNAYTITELTAVLVADGLDDPIFVSSPPNDIERLFVVEQSGRIKIIKGGSLLPTPFLNITSFISTGGERGLLGLAFHPDFSINGYFFINYTNTSGNSVIARLKASSNPDLAEIDSLELMLTVNQPFSNHNAGMLAFSPIDGYLYVGFGDGGSANDPGNRAQSNSTLLGKMLRIDVDNGLPYTIPFDNPYVDSVNIPDEIWAFGLRNPWRYSFDGETGDLYIGDVGQNQWEEVSYQSGASTGGENYGWRLMEGDHCFNPSSNCDPGGLTYPIHEYSHNNGCSITGGYVYRGCAIPDLQGTYFFADYCDASIWTFKYDGTNLTDFMDRTTELDPVGSLDIGGISSFGEDARGELYICDLSDGEMFKIVAVNPVDCNSNGTSDNCDIYLGESFDENLNGIPDECEIYLCGDANSDQSVNVSDAVWIINYVFIGGEAPNPMESGEVNCDGSVNVSDAVWIINYVFVGGSSPCDIDGDTQLDC
jgi:glucose/arabinose dehydrogenase